MSKNSSPIFLSFQVTCKVSSLQGVVRCHGSHSTLDFAVAHVITSPQLMLGIHEKAFLKEGWKLLERIMMDNIQDGDEELKTCKSILMNLCRLRLLPLCFPGACHRNRWRVHQNLAIRRQCCDAISSLGLKVSYVLGYLDPWVNFRFFKNEMFVGVPPPSFGTFGHWREVSKTLVKCASTNKLYTVM